MASSTSKRAFTIVEVLVVITVIALLLGLLLPALGGMRRQSMKNTEMNNLKQVNYAWMLYANHNGDAALPGFVTSEVQQRWRVRYQFPDRKPVPPALPNGGYDPDEDNNIAGPWTWRLLQYLDYSHQIAHSQHEHEFAMLDISSDLEEAKEMAYEPSFGYNGYYIGGVWAMENGTPRYRFFDHCEQGTSIRLSVPQKVAQIRRSSEVITFCSSTQVEIAGVQPRFTDLRPGSYLVVPPYLGTEWQWSFNETHGPDRIITHAPDTHVPMARYTNSAAVLLADGSVTQTPPEALHDARRWIDNATTRDFRHEPCPRPGP